MNSQAKNSRNDYKDACDAIWHDYVSEEVAAMREMMAEWDAEYAANGKAEQGGDHD